MELENESESSPHFVPMKMKPSPHHPNNNQPPVIIRKGRKTTVSRPHSIGATIISNPKLVKGWQYYDNSPQPKSYPKYLSSVNLPSEQVSTEYGSCGRAEDGGDSKRSSKLDQRLTQSTTHLRNSYRRGVGRSYDEENDDIYIPGVEVPARIASDSEFSSELDDEDDDDSYNVQTGKRKSGCLRKLFEIILIIFSTSALALCTILVKQFMEKGYNPYSISLWMFQGMFLPSLILYAICGCCKMGNQSKSHRKNRYRNNFFKFGNSGEENKWTGYFGMWGLLIIGALLGSGGILLKVYSLEFISVTESTAVVLSAPVFIVICGGFYLKEKIGVISILASCAVLGACGIVVLTPYILFDKQFDKDELIGISMTLGCMLITILSVIILRSTRQINFAVVTFLYGFLGSVASLVVACFTHSEKSFQFPEGKYDWLMAGLLVGLTFFGENAIAFVLKYEEAGMFSIMRATEIPMVFLWQFLFLQGNLCYLHNYIGIGLITLAVLVIIVWKFIQKK